MRQCQFCSFYWHHSATLQWESINSTLPENSQTRNYLSQANVYPIPSLQTGNFLTRPHREDTQRDTKVHIWDSEVSTRRNETCLTSGNALLETAVADVNDRCKLGTSSMLYLTEHQEGVFSAGRPTQNFVPSQTKSTFSSIHSPSHIQALIAEPDKKQTLISGLSELEQSPHPLLTREEKRFKSSSHQSTLLARTETSKADVDKGLDKNVFMDHIACQN